MEASDASENFGPKVATLENGEENDFEELDLDFPEVVTTQTYPREHRATVQSGARHLLRGFRYWLFPRSKAVIENDAELEMVSTDANEFETARSSKNHIVLGLEHRVEEFERTEQSVLTGLSRHYVALALACFLILTVIQLVSMTLMLVWEYAPVFVGIFILLISILVYWLYIWKVLRVKFKSLWHTPYPYALMAAILGSLSQHSIFLYYEGYNWAHLLISFFLVEAFYVILVSAAYQEFMNKWEKIMSHRKLCHNAMLRHEWKTKKRIYGKSRRSSNGTKEISVI
mmetsp:Transcript_12422/g.14263  ORF Transcript_12422/g.14263 Transcript_12422/m.14263 type:complete len:286 (+) Transcript_12422:348-1205(+)